MSFYRIYRPQIISEIDNVRVREQLSSLLTKNKKDLPHAYFFHGPKGSGKTTAARIIAKLFNCEKSKGKGPCGTCRSCTSIANGTDIDVLEIDAASTGLIDDVRELRDKIKLSPASGPFKVYIIDEVHMMSPGAFNALLKTLEEPPAHAVFILATTDPQKVPATVRSRCTEIRFAKAEKDELLSALTRIAKKEKISIKDSALTVIADTADGAFRDAVKLLEQISFYKGTITEKTVMELLSKSDVMMRKMFLMSVLSDRDLKASLDCIEKYVSDGGDIKVFTAECLSDLQRELVRQVREGKSDWDKPSVQDFMKRLIQAYGELRNSPIPHLPLELAVAEYIDRNLPAGGQGSAQEEKRSDTGQEDKSTEKRPIEKKISLSSDERKTHIDYSDHLNLEKLTSHWPDFIEAVKPYNHSVAGVVRGARPKSVENGVVTIEAFYKFHQERLSDVRVRDILSTVLNRLFGVKVKVEIVLGKK